MSQKKGKKKRKKQNKTCGNKGYINIDWFLKKSIKGRLS